MLVLTRKVGEKIRIGDDIWLMVVAIDAGKVKLGIAAPDSVPVYRQELLPEGHDCPCPNRNQGRER